SGGTASRSVSGPRPSWAVHCLVRCTPDRCRHRRSEDPASKPSRERLLGAVRAHGPHGRDRSDADLRRTAPACCPDRARDTTIDDAHTARVTSTPARPSTDISTERNKRRSVISDLIKNTNQPPKDQVNTGGRVLAPHKRKRVTHKGRPP